MTSPPTLSNFRLDQSTCYLTINQDSIYTLRDLSRPSDSSGKTRFIVTQLKLKTPVVVMVADAGKTCSFAAGAWEREQCKRFDLAVSLTPFVSPALYTELNLEHQGNDRFMIHARNILLLSIILSGAVSAADRNSESWLTHSTFEDFSSGTLQDGGANTFIARDGKLQMIHRWDLNNDGFLGTDRSRYSLRYPITSRCRVY